MLLLILSVMCESILDILGAEQLLGFLRDVDLIRFPVGLKLFCQPNIDSKETEPELLI